MAQFFREDLQGSSFERVDLSGAQFRTVDLSDASFRGVYLQAVKMRGVELVDVDMHGEIENVTINGVEIVPLVNALEARAAVSRLVRLMLYRLLTLSGQQAGATSSSAETLAKASACVPLGSSHGDTVFGT
ncbi:MAG TPA: pentapeptide repeat-containing protein [Propionibacteriaceae bacterium]